MMIANVLECFYCFVLFIKKHYRFNFGEITVFLDLSSTLVHFLEGLGHTVLPNDNFRYCPIYIYIVHAKCESQ